MRGTWSVVFRRNLKASFSFLPSLTEPLGWFLGMLPLSCLQCQSETAGLLAQWLSRVAGDWNAERQRTQGNRASSPVSTVPQLTDRKGKEPVLGASAVSLLKTAAW